MSERVEAGRVFRGWAKRWWIILMITALFAELGYAASSRGIPVYQGTTSILVGGVLQDSNLTKDDLDASQQLAVVYADAATRQPVLQGVVQNLGLTIPWRQLRNRVTADTVGTDPQLIDITATASTSQEAKSIAGQVADQLIALGPGPTNQEAGQVQQFVNSQLTALQDNITQAQKKITILNGRLGNPGSPPQKRIQSQIIKQRHLIDGWQNNYSSLLSSLAAQGTPNNIQILESATADTNPISPKTTTITVLAGAVGFFLALCLAYLLEFRRRGRHKEEHVGRT